MLLKDLKKIKIKQLKIMTKQTFEIFTKHDPESNIGIYAESKKVKTGLFSTFLGKNEAVKRSQRVLKWFNDKKDAEITSGGIVNGWSLSDCQVSEKPFAFFVVHKELIKKNAIDQRELQTRSKKNFWFPAQIIYNAEILESPKTIREEVSIREMEDPNDKKNLKTKITNTEKDVPNLIDVKEGCDSFPFKKPKRVERYYRIKVRYQIRTWHGFRTITEWVEGLKSHIFQHEIQHSTGRNIFYGKVIRFKCPTIKNV